MILADFCAFCPSLWQSLRSEALTILRREEKSKDHVTEITGIGIQSIQPVLKTHRVRIAPQVTKILHCHKRSIEHTIRDVCILHDVAQHLSAIHRSAIKR